MNKAVSTPMISSVAVAPMIRRIMPLVVLALSVLLGGCGGSSSDDGQTISGTASAPAGTVAELKQENIFQLALNFVVSPVAAAVLGLEPVGGATVELIRIDNDGNQVGDVLATTATSITGDYTLTLPVGTNLSGNLIVRITGTGGLEMRAMVVEEEVNISPVSEFVLSSFIDDGADLENLTTAAVVKLSAQVEEFDLTATGDIATMLALLDDQVGDFIDGQIDLIESTPADTQVLDAVAGNYRGLGLSLGLHDGDGSGYGAFGIDISSEGLVFANGGDGILSVTVSGEDSSWANLSGSDCDECTSLNYWVDIDVDSETFSVPLSAAGVLTLEEEFEEDIDGDYGWRSPATTEQLQKVPGMNAFFGIFKEAGVRYLTVDTNGDNVKDAVDPAQREGDEVMRGFDIFFKQPTDMTDADLDGDFGQVLFQPFVDAGGSIRITTGTKVVSYKGDGNIYEGAGVSVTLTRNTTDSATFYEAVILPTEESEAFTVASNGAIDGYDGYVNDSYNFIVASASVGDSSSAKLPQVLLVKLPTSAPTVNGKVYRLLFLGVSFIEQQMELSASAFDSFLTMSSQEAGLMTLNSSIISKASLGAEVTFENDDPGQIEADVTVAANGATKIIAVEEGEAWVFDGFFNEDATLGFFSTTLTEANSSTDELGIAILIEVTE
ncbi:MAG: hypothetical protein GY779_14785 [Gammaproteobacteria bacterium]|nr:hypothetical protein [Gammaproteobacteria bacterium]